MNELLGAAIGVRLRVQGGARFKSQPGHWITWLRFVVVILSPSRKMSEQYLN